MLSNSHNGKKSSNPPATGRAKLYDVLDNDQYRHVMMMTLLITTLIISIIMMVITVISLAAFRIHQLTMVSNNFLLAPIIMLITSCGAILLTVSGFISLRQRQAQYIINLVNAGLGVLLIIALCASVALSFMLRDNIENDINKVNVDDELRKAVNDDNIMEVWDSLQVRYECCGGVGNSGFHDWESHLNGTYPDSCCTVRYTGCGRHTHRSLETDFKQTVYERLHVKGCFTAVKQVLDVFVVPMLVCWSVLGLILVAVMMVLTIVFLMYAWYLHKLDKSGVRIKSDNGPESCPVHGEKKSSAISSSNYKMEEKKGSAKHSRHSRGRQDH